MKTSTWSDYTSSTLAMWVNTTGVLGLVVFVLFSSLAKAQEMVDVTAEMRLDDGDTAQQFFLYPPFCEGKENRFHIYHVLAAPSTGLEDRPWSIRIVRTVFPSSGSSYGANLNLFGDGRESIEISVPGGAPVSTKPDNGTDKDRIVVWALGRGLNGVDKLPDGNIFLHVSGACRKTYVPAKSFTRR